MITRLLIANRGEIACRIIRSARQLGIETVAVHSAIDADALHVREADWAINLSGAKPGDSYLRADLILSAAQSSGAQAIHPGYGFLSENAAFARACADQGLIFIGPPPAAIEAMGSKAAAKALMEQAGVPLVPGYHGDAQDIALFITEADKIGYPVLLKAVAGGGGKGMKVVNGPAEMADALASAQREAKAAFGDARMLVERYLARPRHIEIQVFADQHGHCIHLNERDCSIQRRHQKVIEEAPAPGLGAELRQRMGEAAVRAAQAIHYVGAGTVEFLLDEQQRFYFMEMNTRLQVEHPITEAITGVDLVAWQLRIAEGNPLPLSQQQVPLHGHAIEARLYAENPEQDFMPASGQLAVFQLPELRSGQRVDSGISEGEQVSPFYDPMLAKLIAWGETREVARLNLLELLRNTRVAGIETNLGFAQRIMQHPAFIAGEVDTGFIPRHAEQLLPGVPELDLPFWQLAGCAWLLSQPRKSPAEDPYSPWAEHTGWRSAAAPAFSLHLSCAGQHRVLTDLPLAACSLDQHKGLLNFQLDGLSQQLRFVRRGSSLFLQWQEHWHRIETFDPLGISDRNRQDAGGLQAPMNGSIVRIAVNPGDQVEAGSLLLVVEAMKMEHAIRAPQAGLVKALRCAEGDMVSEGQLLIDLEPQKPEA